MQANIRVVWQAGYWPMDGLCAAPFIMLLMDGAGKENTNFICLNILVFLIGLKSTNKIAYHLISFHKIRELKAPEMWSKTEIGSLMSEETIWTWCLCVVRLQMNSI